MPPQDRQDRESLGGERSVGSAAVQRKAGNSPGKRTLAEQEPSRGVAASVQRKPAVDGAQGDAGAVHAAAERGTQGPATALPHADQIQRSFGSHDVSQVQAFVGGPAREASDAIGAEAYATGDKAAFRDAPDLHTAAHEAAHVVQQRGAVQLKGGVGAAGDAYERHADAVADRVVAGQSAEDLLAGGAAGGATQAVQRKEGKDDAKILENQANLKGTDVEIPALEGALLATRKEAVKQGLLSQASFNAGLALSQAMTELQPAVAAKGTVDKGLQDKAAVAAQQLFAALKTETADDKNFKLMPSMGASTAVSSQNPYTEEVRVTTVFLIWASTHNLGSWFEELPGFIRQGKWDDAFSGYRRMLDGLDLWVNPQARRRGRRLENNRDTEDRGANTTAKARIHSLRGESTRRSCPQAGLAAHAQESDPELCSERTQYSHRTTSQRRRRRGGHQRGTCCPGQDVRRLAYVYRERPHLRC
jgi:hypothetical protein